MSIYGLIIGICLAASAWYFSKHNQIIPKSKEDLFTIGTIISAIFGARAYHVIEQWTYYSQDPIQILNTRAGGLAIYGGLIGGLLFICFFSILNHVSCILILDLITPILPLAQATGRIGNFINHENPLWWPEAIVITSYSIHYTKLYDPPITPSTILSVTIAACFSLPPET